MFKDFTRQEFIRTFVGSAGIVAITYFMAVGLFLLF